MFNKVVQSLTLLSSSKAIMTNSNRRRRARQIKTSGSFGYPLPLLKSAPELGKRKRAKLNDSMDQDEAEINLHQAFANRLTSIVRTEFECMLREEVDIQSEAATKRLDKLMAKLLASNRAVRGIFEQADEIGGADPGETSRKMRISNSQHIDWWKEFVHSEFSVVVDEVRSNVKVEEKETGKSENLLRTCTVPLSTLIRPDLPEQHREKFETTLTNTMVSLTDHIADLSVIIRSTMINLARRGISIEQTTKTVSLQDNGSGWLHIDDLLPRQAQRHKEAVEVNGKIPVSPIPPIDDINDLSDLRDSFKSRHVSHIFSKYMLPAKDRSTDRDHIFWDQLHLEQFNDVQKVKSGMNHVVRLAVKQSQTNLENMYQGSIFNASLTRLLIVHFRTVLAPRRESSYMEKRNKAAELKKEKKFQQQEASAADRRRKLKRETKYEKQCRYKAEMADSVEQKTRWLKRADMSKIRRDRMYREHQQKSATSGTKKASEELVKRDDAQKILEPSMSDDDSESQEEDESSDQDQKNLVQHGKPAQLKEKETSRKRINVLKAITRDLLAQEDRPSTLEEHHITSAAGRNNDLSSKEVAALQSIYNRLRPFVPTSKYATYPALMLPIIMIANIVQRAAGYATFARDFCPDVRPSHLHSLTVDASSLYELFGSAAGEFDILSENKSVITSELSARHSKSTVFGSFLDLNKVNSVCAEYGLQFQDRMTITPSGLTRLLGEVQPSQNTPISMYDTRRKKGHLRNDSNTMTTTQQSDVEDQVSNLNADIKAAEAELRRKRQSLKLASQKVKSFKIQKKALEKAERPTVTGVLKAAKMERNQHQSAILEQQNDLRHFRKQRHILLKVSSV